MMTVISLLPLAATVALLASGRATALQAGLVGLALMAVAAAMALPDGANVVAFLLYSGAEGAWLSVHIIVVIAGGVFFFLCAQRGDGRTDGADKADPTAAYRRLFASCLLLGPFAESAMGFGVGVIVATAAALRLGARGVDAVVLALFSQALVPWGALAIGTMVGSALSGLPPELLGWWSAVLSVPLLAGYLVFFWRFAAHAGFRIGARQGVIDALWLALAAALLVAANRVLATEIALITSLGPVFVAHMLVHDCPRDAAAWWDAARRAAPYVALTVVLIATRTVPPLARLLNLLVLKPFDGQPALAPFYNPGFWLFAVGAVTLVVYATAAASPVVHEMAKRSWRPSAITLVFVVMAQWMSASGIALALAEQAYAAFGVAALAASPVLAAMGGFLTGSNAVSNGMMMPIQAALGLRADLPDGFLASVQNTTGSNFTLLSPMRVAMGCALAGAAITERDVYARAWPVGAFILSVMILSVAVML
jgi:lactate permease